MVAPNLSLICIVVIALISGALGGNCGTYTATDGTMYDLSLLTKAQSVGYSITSGSYTYLFNLCDNFITPQTQMYCYTNAPVYQISSTSLCYLLGTLPPVIKDGSIPPSKLLLSYSLATTHTHYRLRYQNGPATGVTVVYTNQEDRCQFGTIPRIVNIMISCGAKEAVQTLTEPSTCTYDIAMTSPYACPINAKSSKGGMAISGGSLFLILLLVVIVLYIVGGVVFRYKFQDVEPGVNLLPNLGLWTAVPGLVKDGCIFTYEKIAGLIRGNHM